MTLQGLGGLLRAQAGGVGVIIGQSKKCHRPCGQRSARVCLPFLPLCPFSQTFPRSV